jgi:enoyl-CoA hydratase
MAVVELVRHGHVAVITLNRPEARNALNPEVLVRLWAAWQEVDTADDVRVAVITGAGEKAFCAGADLGQLIPLTTGARKPENEFDEAVVADPTLGRRAMLRDWTPSKPVIAAINGHAIAGGCEIVQGTDIRVAADTARIGVQEAKWALYPLGGSSVRLPRQFPEAIAMELLLTGDLLDAETCLRYGFLNHVVPAGEVLGKALEIAGKIAANGPLAVKAIKAGARAAMNLPEAEAMAVELQHGAPVFRTQDAVEGPRAFMEKRPPVFEGR